MKKKMTNPWNDKGRGPVEKADAKFAANKMVTWKEFDLRYISYCSGIREDFRNECTKAGMTGDKYQANFLVFLWRDFQRRRITLVDLNIDFHYRLRQGWDTKPVITQLNWGE